VTVACVPPVNLLAVFWLQSCAVVTYVIPAGLPPPHEPVVEFPVWQMEELTASDPDWLCASVRSACVSAAWPETDCGAIPKTSTKLQKQDVHRNRSSARLAIAPRKARIPDEPTANYPARSI